MPNQHTIEGATVTRRQALRRGAAAGAVIWAVPTVVSSTAHATNGSNGALGGGPLDGVTCVWDRTYFQPNRGTSVRPKFDLSTAAYCEINVGAGWTLLGRNEKFVIPAGQVCQYRPFRSHSGGRTAEPPDAPAETPTTTAAPEPEPVAETTTTTTTSTTTPTVPDTTSPDNSATTDAKVTATTNASTPSTTVAEAAPESTLAPEAPPVALDPLTTDVVDTVVIDMSGRTDVAIGDVYGYFRVVDLDPA